MSTTTHNFQVHLGGVLDVLANHLYSSEKVFIRELLQNACDAITARQLSEPSHAGAIHVELHTQGPNPLLVIEDNGIGLNEAEVQQFLSSIGSSSKKEHLGNQRDQFIGQFGIGLLSCFMVSDQITLMTRAKGHPAVKWVGKVDGTYDLSLLDTDLDIGTKVYITAKTEHKSLFSAQSIQHLLRHYGEILPFFIEMRESDAEQYRCINPEPPVWERGYADKGTRRLDILRYGTQVFEAPFDDYLDVNLPEFGVNGVAYILPYSANVNTRQAHRVYLKKMLISNTVDNILPEWCFFVRAVLNVTKLRPTASRERFYEDVQLEVFRQALGNEVRRYLFGLAQNDPAKLERIIGIHEQAFKQIALHDDDFFQMIIPFLRFQTTNGPQMLRDIKDSTIRHIPNVDEFRKMAPVATASNLMLINSGYLYDAALLRKLAESGYVKPIEQLNAKDFLDTFGELTTAEKEQTVRFMQVAKAVLRTHQCTPDIKKFEPDNLPMLYYMSGAVDRDRTIREAMTQSNPLWNNLLHHLVGDVTQSDYSVLCFNFNNPVVQRLLGMEHEELLSNLLQVLYVNALMLGHHPVNSKELHVFNTNILHLANWVSQQK
jgi:molecular chaperone HtpG